MQFLTRPFVVGDRIELKTAGGGSVMSGQVESIEPMRTVIDAGGIPVAVPNKAILDMLICNESKLQRPTTSATVTRVLTSFENPGLCSCCRFQVLWHSCLLQKIWLV